MTLTNILIDATTALGQSEMTQAELTRAAAATISGMARHLNPAFCAYAGIALRKAFKTAAALAAKDMVRAADAAVETAAYGVLTLLH